MTVAVVTDSTHYLPADVLARHDVHVVSLYVKRSDTLERENEIRDLDAFYERLRSASDVPTTSQPSVGDFLAVYEPLLDAGHDIVSIHLSSAVSGTYDSARQARAQLAERGLGKRVAVIDSRSGAAGLGLAAIAAANRARVGLTSRPSRHAPRTPPSTRGSGSASTRSSTCAAAGASAARRRGSAAR